jgi:hypothetical protein
MCDELTVGELDVDETVAPAAILILQFGFYRKTQTDLNCNISSHKSRFASADCGATNKSKNFFRQILISRPEWKLSAETFPLESSVTRLRENSQFWLFFNFGYLLEFTSSFFLEEKYVKTLQIHGLGYFVAIFGGHWAI